MVIQLAMMLYLLKVLTILLKGDLEVENKILISNGCSLIVEGSLLVHSKILGSCGSIYAKSITVADNISILKGNISTFKDLTCMNVHCYGGDICVGGNANIGNVLCRNYLVDGYNNSFLIKAEKSVYIMEYSNNSSITAPEVFLGGGGNFNGGSITSNHFEVDGHIYNCLGRSRLS